MYGQRGAYAPIRHRSPGSSPEQWPIPSHLVAACLARAESHESEAAAAHLRALTPRSSAASTPSGVSVFAGVWRRLMHRLHPAGASATGALPDAGAPGARSAGSPT